MEKHFTATVYIISKIEGEIKILLHKHKKLNMWLGIGGHVEKDEDPFEAAMREVIEETGLEVEIISMDKKLFESKGVTQLIPPVLILEEDIPASKKEKGHKHIDFIYFAGTKNPQKVKMNEEFGWFSKEDMQSLKIGKDVQFIAKKAFRSYRLI